MEICSLNDVQKIFSDMVRSTFVGTPWPAIDQISAHQDALFNCIHEHGLTPTLLHHLAPDNLRSLPEALKGSLLSDAKQEAVREYELMAEFRELARSFAECKINVILFKGTALSLQLYKINGHRPRGDTDLFVSCSDFVRCHQMLLDHGYTHQSPEAGALVISSGIYTKSGRFGVIHEIDLHRSITSTHHPYRDYMSFDTVWQQSECLDALPENVRVPGAKHAFLHACFHAAQHYSHMGNRLLWLYDIHLLLGVLSAADLRTIWRDAKQLQLGSVVAFYLNETVFWFGSAISVDQLAEVNIFGGDASLALLEQDISLGRANRVLLNLDNIDGAWGKFKFLWQRLFPPSNVLLNDGEGRWLLPLRYAQRLAMAFQMLLEKLTSDRSESK